MQLNRDQQFAVEGVLDEFYGGDAPGRGLSIIGEGGTGKTYCTMAIVQELMSEFRILLTAPTNKAVKQLERAARERGITRSVNVDFKTIHNALGLGVMPSDERKYVAKTRDSVVGKFDFVIGDEASMLNKFVINNYVLPELRSGERRPFHLQLGDNWQLPPVREVKSTAFDLYDHYELTINERVLTNPDGSLNSILPLVRALRSAIEHDKPFKATIQPDQNLVVFRDADFLKTIVQYFDFNTDLDTIRVLAWTNERVNDVNNAIRAKVFGTGAPRYEVGERVVTGEPIRDEEGNTILSTDEECIVAAVSESSLWEESTGKEWKTLCLCLNPLYAEVGQVFAHVLDESERAAYDSHCKRLANLANEAKGQSQSAAWRKFWEFKELFADIKYCYCITVHRSQGSTYDTAIVDVKNILKNARRAERQRLLCVGFSRARRQLVLNKTEFIA